MEAKLKQIKKYIEFIRNFGQNTRKTGTANWSLGYLNGRITLLDSYWATFGDLYQILIETPKSSLESDIEVNYSAVEDLYSTALGEINEAIQEFVSPSSASSSPSTSFRSGSINPALAQQSAIKLPTVIIPTFSGDYSSWNSFCDLFTSVIRNNNTLSNVQKLYHLKSSLSGEAANLLRQFAVTDNNFEPAWALLTRRFANKRLLLNSQFEKLLAQPKLSDHSPSGLKKVLDTSQECITSIENLLNADLRYEALLLYIVTQKLDSKTLEAWELSVRGSEEPASIAEFVSFMEQTYRTMELVQLPSTSTINTRNAAARSKFTDNRHVKSHHISTKGSKSERVECVYCKQGHMLYACSQFKELPIEQRTEFVSRNGLCVGCFSNKHSINNCPSQRTCVVCNEHHNTLLHGAHPSSVAQTAPRHNPFKKSPLSTTPTVNSLHLCSNRQVLLATALVSLQSSTGQWHTLRALLDQGSQATFITQSAANILRLPSTKIMTSINVLGNSGGSFSKSISRIVFKSLYNDIHIQAEAIVLSKLTGLLPSSTIEASSWNHLAGLKLADPKFFEPAKIDILIGSDIFPNLLLGGLRKGEPGSPIAQETTLGWILSGNIDSIAQPLTNRSIEVTSYFADVTISDQLQRFWKLEEIVDEPKMSKANMEVEEHFSKTHSRAADGVYTVQLPFKDNKFLPEFGCSWNQAFVRLQQMEKRYVRNPELDSQYRDFIDEYANLGHMNQVRRYSKFDTRAFYLPHHAVVKESSTTTKVRVVFDASCKSSNGTSLNDQLLVGPALQQDLHNIMIRWRTHRVAVTADIEKMFRQIRVAKEHQPYQRIIWRDRSHQLKVFELNTVTYGTACAPYLSIRVMRQLAIDERHNYPLASERTLSDMYVDDLISGADTEDDAIVLQRELIEMFRSGGFTLRKWSSNYSNVVNSVPADYRENSVSLDISKDDVIKTLGIYWKPRNDEFFFKVNLSTNIQFCTKRVILSDVARIYDPLGWLAPVVIKAKIMLQELWLKGVNWDEDLPQGLLDQWISLRQNLVLLETITIPRWIGKTSSNSNIELHGFCDASLKAYAAVIYSRVVEDNKIFTVLLTAKTRVAPLKQISLPNLELCGATILAKLLKKVATSMHIPHRQCYAWTDSSIVLSWLSSSSHKKVFVANRINTILDTIEPQQWSHVRSAENPADIASRGICPSKLKSFELWWSGPLWLSKSKDTWPSPVFQIDEAAQKDDFIEALFVKATATSDVGFCISLLKKYSTLKQLVRTTSMLFRFASNCRIREKSLRIYDCLSTLELRRSLDFWIKFTQSMDYSEEISILRKLSSLPATNRLITLNPFLCENGFLRVGGRLQNADVQFDAKCPILLEKGNAFTKLLIYNTHVETLHGGLKLTLATLRQRYWIPNARTAIRSCIFQCIICHKASPITSRQIMAPLPHSRVTPAKVFSHSGVDYAGPIDVRMSKHRGKGTMKGYVCLFVCFTTKAVHIELVSDLSATTFIAAFKRFVARRGSCTDLYSDCGTNFVGANRILGQQLQKTLTEIYSVVGNTLANQGTQWHFNAPGSPHMGGLWEASVKSFKYHLNRITGNSLLTFEELYTVLTQIEAVLNSRPLCPISNDPKDIEALTPGHFLVGCPLNAVPHPTLLDTSLNLLTRWQLVEKVNQDFWKSWTNDYLQELHQRPKKWAQQKVDISVGDMVLVKDDRTAPGSWPLARVIDVHPGQDGHVRVATIRHKSGITKRPIVKLSLLPINITQNITQ